MTTQTQLIGLTLLASACASNPTNELKLESGAYFHETLTLVSQHDCPGHSPAFRWFADGRNAHVVGDYEAAIGFFRWSQDAVDDCNAIP